MEVVALTYHNTETAIWVQTIIDAKSAVCSATMVSIQRRILSELLWTTEIDAKSHPGLYIMSRKDLMSRVI